MCNKPNLMKYKENSGSYSNTKQNICIEEYYEGMK
jgi:hypothetical protein